MRRGIRSVRCLPERPSGRWRCVLRLRGAAHGSACRVGEGGGGPGPFHGCVALAAGMEAGHGTGRPDRQPAPPGGVGPRVAKRRAEQHRWRRGPRHVLRNRLLIQCVAAYVDGIRVRSSFLTLLFRRRLVLDRLPAWPGRCASVPPRIRFAGMARGFERPDQGRFGYNHGPAGRWSPKGPPATAEAVGLPRWRDADV